MRGRLRFGSRAEEAAVDALSLTAELLVTEDTAATVVKKKRRKNESMDTCFSSFDIKILHKSNCMLLHYVDSVSFLFFSYI